MNSRQRVLAPGYILDYANILHEDIPPENSLAMYTADRTFDGELVASGPPRAGRGRATCDIA